MRRTGQTFRTLLGSLTAASKGQNIIYECTNTQMAIWTFEKAISIVSQFMEPVSPEPLTLKIGQGTIRFTGKLTQNQYKTMLLTTKHEFVTDY